MSANTQNQPTLPGLELPARPSELFDPASMRHVGHLAAQESVERDAEIAEMRGDNLGAEQTGFTPDIVAQATATSNPSRPELARPEHPKPRRRASGGQRPDASDDPRTEGLTHEQLYPSVNEAILTDEQVAINRRGMDLVRQAYNPPKRGER